MTAEGAQRNEVPLIGEEMLHQGCIDLEAGMSDLPPVTLALMAA